jgi:hypothetical protein
MCFLKSLPHVITVLSTKVCSSLGNTWGVTLFVGAPDCPVAHRTVNSTRTVHAENPLIGWFPFLWGTGPSGAPCDHWLLSTWQIAVARLEHQTIWRLTRTVKWFIADVARGKLESEEFRRPCTRLSGAHQTVRWSASDRPVLRSQHLFLRFFVCFPLILLAFT